MYTNNPFSKALYIISIIQFISGVIGGFILAKMEVDIFYSSYTEFSWIIFLISIFSGIISGIFFMGMAEIVNQLTALNSKLLKFEDQYK